MRRLSPLLSKRTIIQEDFFNSSINLREMSRVDLVRSAPMNAEFQKEGGAAFHPQFFFKDLPVTLRGLAIRCKEAAEKEGLRRVTIGNLHLL